MAQTQIDRSRKTNHHIRNQIDPKGAGANISDRLRDFGAEINKGAHIKTACAFQQNGK